MYALAVTTLLAVSIGTHALACWRGANVKESSLTADGHKQVQGDALSRLQTSFSGLHVIFLIIGLCGMILLLYYVKSEVLTIAIQIVFVVSAVCGLALAVSTNNKIRFFALLPAIAIGIAWLILRDEPYAWILQDILAVGVCVLAVSMLKAPSLKLSTFLLVLALLYDVFWVFIAGHIFPHANIQDKAGAGVMEEVVKSNLPNMFKIPDWDDDFLILGLGDVILPGVQGCYLLASKHHSSFFLPHIFAYLVGISIAMTVAISTDTGQPALLFIVPAIVGVVVLSAWRKGELGALWNGDVDVATAKMAEESQLLLKPQADMHTTCIQQPPPAPKYGTMDIC
eukprot:GILJ01002893.1.p1 GENE.GILJ01002893.1~~GILJ01002893.1.p1  ORF type:complete len:340 (-),score=40.33 GILJ01002893.1:133-1152(-)